MAHAITNTTLPFGALTAHQVITFFADTAARIRDWNERRRTVALLSQLSDSQLDDIGLVRADIEDMMGARF